MNKQLTEMLLNLQHQGYMPDIDKFYLDAKKEKGIAKAILISGYVFYRSLMLEDLYIPMAEDLIKQTQEVEK